jgi:AcrR family transcriptional regulator
MARLSRDESRMRTRNLLLDAAERVFARRGYRGASLDDIAAEAGFSKGAVYSNFTGKEDLFLALLDRRRVGAGAPLGGALGIHGDEDSAFTPGSAAATTRPSPGRGAGRAGTQGLVEAAAPADAAALEWGLLTLEFFLYAAREPAVRDRLAAAYEEQRSSLAAALETNWPALASGPLQLRDLASAVMALSTGLGVQAVLDPSAVDPRLFARVLDALVAASTTRSPTARERPGADEP